ncbi:MAG TPA: CHASE2 domain-containing protein [Vicinamibacterales bacterium]|nr:CHASE2 domain-containing protein [Vicinamibacterales bacterium]
MSRFLKQFLWATATILTVSVLTLVLEHFHFLDRFETTGLDAFNLLQAPRDPSDLVVVGIYDEDYTRLFNETSPLGCERLKEILDAIAAGKPRVIGVDLDTSPPMRFDCLVTAAGWPPMVWAADAEWDQNKNVFFHTPVLGGRVLERPRDSHGIALFPQDGDGVVRRYLRRFPTEAAGLIPSFAWAVIEAGCKAQCEVCCRTASGTKGQSSEGLRLNFAGDRFNFTPLSVQDVLKAVEADKKAGGQTAWGTDGLLTHKIVLLGGNYRAARDTQITPIGRLNGVQIHAQAIESELHGGGIGSLEIWQELALDVVIGYALFLVNYWLRSRLAAALAVSLLLIPLLCLGASYAVFSAFAFWLNFIPVVASVLIHVFYEQAREYQKLAAAHHA